MPAESLWSRLVRSVAARARPASLVTRTPSRNPRVSHGLHITVEKGGEVIFREKGSIHD